MAVAGTLEIQLLANIARLQSDMTQAKGAVGSAMKSIESSVAMAKSALASLGIGLGVGYFVSLIKGSIDAMDHLNDLHKTLDISVEKLTGLKLLAKQTGADLDSLAASIAKLSVNVGKDPEKFAALGITAKDNVGAFKQLADILGKTVDVHQKEAIAAATLGKSWMGSMPALSEGSKRIQEIIEKGERLAKTNAVMTQAADDFNDKLAEISAASSGTVSSLVGGLLPALTMLANNFELVRNIVLSLTAAKLAGWAAESAEWLYVTVTANMAKTAATLAAAQTDAVATGAAVALTTARMAEMRAAAAAASGDVALAITLNGLVPMQAKAATAAVAHAVALDALAVAQRAASVSSGLAAGALGLLSGPIGWITLALGLGATAWAFWGKSAEDAGKQAEDSLARGLALAKRLQNEAKFGTGDTGVLNEALIAAKQKLQVELENYAAAQKIATNESDRTTVEKSYGKDILESRDAVSSLEVALTKTKSAATGLTEEQKKQAAANAAFLKADKAVADTESAYKAMYKTLSEMLLLERERTEVTKLQMTLDAMKAKEREKFKPGEEDALKRRAAEVDLHKQRLAQMENDAKNEDALAKMWQEGAEATAAYEKVRTDAILAADKQIEQMKFETTLIGKTNIERETAIFLRQAEIDKIDLATIARGKEAIAAKHAAQVNFDADPVVKSIKDVVEYLDPAKAHSFGDALKDAFGGASNALVKLGAALKDYGQKQEEIAKLQKALADDPSISAEKRIKMETGLAEKQAEVQLRAYGDMAGAAAGFFDSQSKGYAALMTVSRVFHMAEIAMELAKMVPKAINAILTQGEGDPYSAFPRMAAMAAIVAGLGVAVGGGGGGFSGGSSTPPVTNKGTGTVLGDSEAQSQSIRDSIKNMESMAKPQLTFIGQMVALLRNIDNTLAGTTDALLSSGFDARGSSFQGSKTSDSTLWGLFGSSSSSTSLADLGLIFAKQTVAEAMRMINVSQYQTTKTDWTESGFLGFGSDSGTNYSTSTSGIDPSIGASMSRAVAQLVTMLGVVGARVGASPGAIAALGSTDTGFGNVSLIGKTGDEINQILSAVFSKLGDTLTRQLVPEIGEFQKSGEGLLQTLIRVVANNDYVTDTLQQLGVSLNLTGMAAYRVTDAIVTAAGGLDKFAEKTKFYYENFFSDAERQANLIANLTKAFDALGLVTPTSNAGFRALVESLDLTTAAGQATFTQLMALAPAFNTMTEAAKAAETAVLSLAQQISDAQKAAVSAVDDQIQASRAASQTARQAADSYRQITTSLADAVTQIMGGGRAETGAKLEALFGTAMTGDSSALSGLPQAAKDYLAASQSTSKTATEFARDQAKVVGMLNQAQLVSTAMVNWNEYHATLLETQTGVLEAIKEQLELPSPDASILTQQLEMLSTISGLLQEQTVQIVSGYGLQAVLVQDQTGKIEIGNTLVGTQTGQIITGNATQDVIKNIADVNKDTSLDMLAELVSGSGAQSDSLAAMVQGNARITGLLEQLVALQGQASTADYNTRFDEAVKQIYATTGTIPVETLVKQYDDATDEYYWETVTKQKFDLASFDAAVAAWRVANPIPTFAEGGLASGLSMVGERGRELVDFASPARVYTADQTRGMLGGAANDDVLAELQALRQEVAGLRQSSTVTAQTTKRHYDLVRNMTPDGQRLQTVAA